MLDGVIDSTEVNRVKAAVPSRGTNLGTRRGLRQDAAENARLREELAQRDAHQARRDAHYESYLASLNNHWTNAFQQGMHVVLLFIHCHLKHWAIQITYQMHTRLGSKARG